MAVNDPLPTADFKSLLDAQWNASNVVEPLFREVNSSDAFVNLNLANDSASTDAVVIFPGVPAIEETFIGNHSYGDREYNLQIQVFSMTSRQRLWDLMREIRRICHAQRHSMTNFQRVLFRSMNEVDLENNENIWHGVIDVVLENRSISLEIV